jgi:hypothetical protein
VAALAKAALVKKLANPGPSTHDPERTSDIVYNILAAKIIAAAQKGERYPVRLRNAGLASPGTEAEMN